MADTSTRETAIEIARLIEEHKGVDTRVIDLSGQTSWTDFFVISTVSGSGHLQGVLRHLYEFLDSRNLSPRNRHRRASDDGWILVDCGGCIVHLMDREKRAFYDLENLWFSGVPVSHSSKSS